MRANSISYHFNRIPDWIHFILVVLYVCAMCALAVSCIGDNPSYVNMPKYDIDMSTYYADMSVDMTPVPCTISGKLTCSPGDMSMESLRCQTATGEFGLCECSIHYGCCCLR